MNNDNLNKKEEKQYLEKLIKTGKLISIKASKDKKLEDKLKKLSSY